MKERFSGEQNLGRFLTALKQQPFIFDDTVAAEIARMSRLEEFAPGDTLIHQDHSDQHILLILLGRVSILVNKREIAIRMAGQHVGEMALIDPSAKRSASVVALEQTITARIEETDFVNLATKYPAIWRLIAAELGSRLRQRNQFVKTPNPRPVLFLGSSAEALKIVQAIEAEFADDDIIVRPWSRLVFGPSHFPIDDLEEQIATSDFATLVISPDDRVLSRFVWKRAPRDNVVFELGLFMGALSRKRTFLLAPKKMDIKIPSDLLGLTPLSYSWRSKIPLAQRLSPACEELRRVISELGPK